MMTEKHLSTQFDAELNSVCARVTEMGGLVEQQVRNAVQALALLDSTMADTVVANEKEVNNYEVHVDRDVSSIIGRRQPTARDLRLLIAISKIATNLERAGDEAKKIARMSKSIIESGSSRTLPRSELNMAAELAGKLIHNALNAFARLDMQEALVIMKEDGVIDREFGGFVRILITYMMEDPRQISPSLNLLFLAKAIERIGDHAKNIAEQIIYIVQGADVRHASIAETESAIS